MTLSTTTKCDQNRSINGYDFSLTLLRHLSPTWMFKIPPFVTQCGQDMLPQLQNHSKLGHLNKPITHRHLSNVDCLMARTACHVCFISTVNDCSKKEALEDWH